VYELQSKRVRLDATKISGYHAGEGEDNLFQFGYSKDDPTLRQVKVMVAAFDPLGMPLVSDVVAGDSVDNPLYILTVDRVLQIIAGVGLLFMGDSKMSALAIRAHIHHRNQHYLCPLAMTGNTERPKHEIVTVRCQITAVIRQEEAIAELRKILGWRAYVSDAPAEHLTLEQAVLTYWDEWLIERGFLRLKGAPLSLDPLFVKRDDHWSF
jgi:transposase